LDRRGDRVMTEEAKQILEWLEQHPEMLYSIQGLVTNDPDSATTKEVLEALKDKGLKFAAGWNN